jgi:uncharacterized damage-inducible protein DinB
VKHALRISGTTAAIVLIGMLGAASAQTVSIHAEMTKDWESLKETMKKIANEMPADKYTAKPTPAQQDFGTRVLHVAQVNARFLGALGGKATAPTFAATMTSKEASMKAMDDSFDYGLALLKEFNDQSMVQAAPTPPQFLGPSTRARIFTFLIGHTWDIYGQLVVYLRLNGGVPPASQRP